MEGHTAPVHSLDICRQEFASEARQVGNSASEIEMKLSERNMLRRDKRAATWSIRHAPIAKVAKSRTATACNLIDLRLYPRGAPESFG